MRGYLYCGEAGLVEKQEWLPNSWVNVECPDADDFDFLTKTLGVPESFLDDIADVDERSRTEIEGDWLLTILRIPVQSDVAGIPFTTVPLGVITNNDIIVSICYYHSEMLTDFIEHTRKKSVLVRNKLDLIFRLIYSSAVWFLKYLKQINVDVTAAEKELEKSIKNEDLLRLMKLQKTLVYFNTSIRGNEVLIGKLKTIFSDTDYLDADLVEDVVIELKQAYNTVNIYSDILTGTMDAFASHHLQQRQRHHETYDQSFHHADDSDVNSQFLWNERRYSSGRDATCLCLDCHCFRRFVRFIIR